MSRIFNLSENTSLLHSHRNEGLQKGIYCGWERLDELFSLKKKATTYVFGSPYSGKTEIMLDIIIFTAKQYNWKWALFMPENGDCLELIAELATKYIGKPYYKQNPYSMSESEVIQAEMFIEKHFVIMNANENSFTIEQFYETIRAYEVEKKVTIDGSLADPFNEFEFNLSLDNGRQDLYIERALGLCRKDAIANNRHNIIITHSTDNQMLVEAEDINGNKVKFLPKSMAHNVSGGKAWHRKAHQLVNIWRCPKGVLNPDNGIPYEENEMEFSVLKSKPKGVGKVGKVSMFFNFKNQQYYMKDDFSNEMYASKRLVPTRIEPSNYMNVIENNEPPF